MTHILLENKAQIILSQHRAMVIWGFLIIMVGLIYFIWSIRKQPTKHKNVMKSIRHSIVAVVIVFLFLGISKSITNGIRNPALQNGVNTVNTAIYVQKYNIPSLRKQIKKNNKQYTKTYQPSKLEKKLESKYTNHLNKELVQRKQYVKQVANGTSNVHFWDYL